MDSRSTVQNHTSFETTSLVKFLAWLVGPKAVMLYCRGQKYHNPPLRAADTKQKTISLLHRSSSAILICHFGDAYGSA